MAFRKRQPKGAEQGDATRQDGPQHVVVVSTKEVRPQARLQGPLWPPKEDLG